MADLKKIETTIFENNLDYGHFALARFMKNNYEQASDFCIWLMVLVNVEVIKGNVCLEVRAVKEKSLQLGWDDLPSDNEISHCIKTSVLTGEGDDDKPIILDNERLYLHRFFHNEKNIASWLLGMAQEVAAISGSEIKNINDQFKNSEGVDLQKLAAIISYRHRLSIITGGPGTGKTWVVAKILILLLQQKNDLKIKLAAPTGKAAAHLSTSIQALNSQFKNDSGAANLIPDKVVTLHRLLGIHRFTHRPRYRSDSPLDCEVLVIDEASMIDQQMMAALCAALPTDCKLILLGDKDQLSSVEAGNVFADLCGDLRRCEFNAEQNSWLKKHWEFELPRHDSGYRLANHVVVLEKSHRFDDQSGIGLLAKYINRGDPKKCLQLLTKTDGEASLIWKNPASSEMKKNLQSHPESISYAMTQAESLQQAFSLFFRYQILAAVWDGPAGVDKINAVIEDSLKLQLGINPDTPLYAGKPLMMSANVTQYDIHNGDIGIVWPDEKEQLKIYFELGGGEYRGLSLSQCPPHNTAYAMTVHKAQGSEFGHVVLVLPATKMTVCTRELFYTAVTRASSRVEIWAGEEVIDFTIQQKTRRASGLLAALKHG